MTRRYSRPAWLTGAALTGASAALALFGIWICSIPETAIGTLATAVGVCVMWLNSGRLES